MISLFFNKDLEKTKFKFDGEIRCVECDTKIKKTFMQGYCYPCFISNPKTSECILKPELCRAHEGEARDMQWAEKHCLQDQYIYLSLTINNNGKKHKFVYMDYDSGLINGHIDFN